MIKLLTIIPRLPPSIDGVGDYALYLAQNLKKQWQIETEFIVCDPSWKSQPEIQGFRVTHLKERSTSAFLQLIATHHPESTKIFLHYVGYGYARWGAPSWFIQALAAWRSQPNHELLTMFHELYNPPGHRPWKHMFWNSHIQQSLTKQLAQFTDHAVTSGQQYAATLDQFRGPHSQPTPFLPVFSTVGEPTQIPNWTDREPILVVFGQTMTKRRAYTETYAQLQSICERFQIQEVVDVGPSTGLTLTNIGTVPLREAGKLSIEAIGDLFGRSRIGFLNYNPHHLAKSTIFAAYCAYGLLPINTLRSHLSCDGITAGEQYWTLDETKNEPEKIVEQAHEWYASHSLTAQADFFAQQGFRITQNLVGSMT
jgi:hypothetical protein